jgi:transcriptional regulator with XRE-family HTH domain
MTHAGRILGRIRGARLSRRIKVARAHKRAGINQDYWYALESGKHPGVSLETAARMAEACGLRLDVVSATDEPETFATLPEPPRRRVRDGYPPGPVYSRLMRKIKAHRESLGVTHTQAGACAGWAKSTWGNMERGHYGGTVSVDRLQQAADAVGLRLELLAPYQRGILAMDADEVDALADLLRAFLRSRPGAPEIFRSAADKLESLTRVAS